MGCPTSCTAETTPGAGLSVRLNLGNRFGAVESWGGSAALREEQSASMGRSGGLGKTLPAYSFGGGIADTVSVTGASQDLIDVNGDGLVDIVSKPLAIRTASAKLPPEASSDIFDADDTFVTVRFNTGAGFAAPVQYNGALPQPLRGNATFSRNLGLHFTIAIPIPFTPISIILNPGQYHGRSLGGYDVMLSDFDGDGYADHVYSDSTGKIAVQLNNHGRTNLLKSVDRPLGATIELDYARSGNTTDQPGNRWVLAEDDGRRRPSGRGRRPAGDHLQLRGRQVRPRRARLLRLRHGDVAPGRPGQPGDDPAPVHQHLPHRLVLHQGPARSACAWATARAGCLARPSISTTP